jgi:hypothetical protein
MHGIPGPKIQQVAQIDRLHAYLTCHVEIFEKGRVVNKKSVVEGSRKHIYEGNVAKKGLPRHARIKSVAK